MTPESRIRQLPSQRIAAEQAGHHLQRRRRRRGDRGVERHLLTSGCGSAQRSSRASDWPAIRPSRRFRFRPERRDDHPVDQKVDQEQADHHACTATRRTFPVFTFQRDERLMIV